MMVFLISCQSDQGETMVLLDEKVTAVKVSHSNGFGGMNEDVFLTIEVKKDISVFKKAILSAVKQPGQVDIAVPEYDLMVEYGELPTHAMHLWLGEEDEKSIFMYLEDDSVYLTSVGMTKKLRDLILGL
jgi:hypothetical protein